MSDDALRELAKVDVGAAKIAFANGLPLSLPVPVPATDDVEDDGFVTVVPRLAEPRA